MNLSLAETRSIGGFVRASLINARHGFDFMMEKLDESETANLDRETATMAQTYSKRVRDRQQLGCNKSTVELIIREDERYHLMRSVDGVPDVLVHVVLDRRRANLLNARARLAHISRDVSAGLRAADQSQSEVAANQSESPRRVFPA